MMIVLLIVLSMVVELCGLVGRDPLGDAPGQVARLSAPRNRQNND